MAALSFPVLIASIPPVTRAFTSATFAATLLYAWLRWQFGLDYNPFIALIPGSSFLYPWTFFTSGLSETSVFEVGILCSSLHSPLNLAAVCCYNHHRASILTLL
jgi:drug/metabolite transporter (DMT)-like permease